jgi:hypothetical protein
MTKHVVDVEAVIDDATGLIIGLVIAGIPGVAPIPLGISAAVPAPAAINAANAETFNATTVIVQAGSTLTIDSGAWAALGAGLNIQVGQSGSATLAFTGGAVKENASGTSAANVTLSAAGVYALTQSPSGSAAFRLVGGAPQ